MLSFLYGMVLCDASHSMHEPLVSCWHGQHVCHQPAFIAGFRAKAPVGEGGLYEANGSKPFKIEVSTHSMFDVTNNCVLYHQPSFSGQSSMKSKRIRRLMMQKVGWASSRSWFRIPAMMLPVTWRRTTLRLYVLAAQSLLERRASQRRRARRAGRESLNLDPSPANHLSRMTARSLELKYCGILILTCFVVCWKSVDNVLEWCFIEYLFCFFQMV